MTVSRDPNRLIGEFLDDGLTELPDRAYDAVRSEIDHTRQRVVIGPWREEQVSKYAILAIAAAAAVLAVVVGIQFLPRNGGIGGQPTASPTPTPSPLASLQPLPGDGPLPAGRYLYDRSQFAPVTFTFTVPDGWFVENGGWNMGTSGDPVVPGPGFVTSIVDRVNADSCTGTAGEQIDAGSTVDDLVNALLDQSAPAVDVEGPFAVSVGGYSGQRLDVTAPPAAELVGCMVSDPRGLQLWFDQANNWYVVIADWQSSIYIVDVGGERVVLATQYQESSPADVTKLDALIESIEFEP